MPTVPNGDGSSRGELVGGDKSLAMTADTALSGIDSVARGLPRVAGAGGDGDVDTPITETSISRLVSSQGKHGGDALPREAATSLVRHDGRSAWGKGSSGELTPPPLLSNGHGAGTLESGASASEAAVLSPSAGSENCQQMEVEDAMAIDSMAVVAKAPPLHGGSKSAEILFGAGTDIPGSAFDGDPATVGSTSQKAAILMVPESNARSAEKDSAVGLVPLDRGGSVAVASAPAEGEAKKGAGKMTMTGDNPTQVAAKFVAATGAVTCFSASLASAAAARARTEEDEKAKKEAAAVAAVVQKQEQEHARTRAAAAAAAARAKAAADEEEKMKAEAKEQQAKREYDMACSRLLAAKERVCNQTQGWSVEQLLVLRGGALELTVALCGRAMPRSRSGSAGDAVFTLLQYIDHCLS